MFKTILLPIDQSRVSIATAAKAVEIAKVHKSRIILLSVLQDAESENNSHESVMSLLNQTKEKLCQSGIESDVLKKEGKPAFVICDVADELNIDLILMGTRGMNLEGNNESIAALVIQLAPCPVLIVP